MEKRSVITESREHVAIIRLNAPEKLNALTEEMIRELMEAIRWADESPDIYVMILTGSGKAFCAGGDINEFKEIINKKAPTLYQEGLWSSQLFKLGATVRTPIIAAVNGPALGGGCGLVAMCHIVVASDQATFGTPELRLGLVPYVILPWIRRAVGHKKALEMFLTAEVISAEQAKEIGLVQRVVRHDKLEEEAWALASRIASFSPLAVRLGLDAFYNSESMDLLKSFDYLSTLRIVSFLSEDLREGATAFLERRPPVWKGC